MKPYQKSLFTLAFGFFSALIVWTGMQNYLNVQRFPRLDEVRRLSSQPRPQLLDRQGRALEEIPLDEEQLYWAPLAKISPEFVEAAVKALDPAFFRHSGIDFSTPWGFKKPSLSAEASRLVRGKSRESRLKLILGGLLLEREWTKDEILEAYLNLASFGPKLRGVEAASRGLLGKELLHLTSIDSAILAGVLRSQGQAETMSGEDVAQIACKIFQETHPESSASTQAEACATMTKISRSLGEAPLLKESKLGLAPELARRINSLPALDLSSIKPIQTPIDREAQTQALALLREQSEGAILVLDNRTGEALVYASLDPEKGSLPTKRLPIGSAFLPFLVGMGLEERVIQWSAPEIRESIRNEKTMDSLYGRLGGALALERKMPQMGLLSFKSGSEFWPSAFGVQPWFELDTSLEELVQAYLIVARQGVTADMKIVSLDERTSKERIVFSPGVALQIASGLAESSKAYWQSGFSSVAGEDWAWSLAFTTRFTIGALARDQVKAELLRQGMSDYLHAEELRLAQKRTAPIAPAPQIFSPVKVPEKTSYDALALKSAAPIRPSPKVEAKSAPNSLGRIRNPRDGASISMRLNSPINFRMQPYDGRLVWILNGRTLGTAKEVGAWRPSPGDWRLTLRDARGTLIDEVLFEVR